MDLMVVASFCFCVRVGGSFCIGEEQVPHRVAQSPAHASLIRLSRVLVREDCPAVGFVTRLGGDPKKGSTSSVCGGERRQLR